MTDETASPLNSPAKNPTPDNLALVGFMGAGKSTVGQALAAKLDWRFLDLDDLIQAREGRSIVEVFAQSGEAAFRNLERRVLSEIVASLRFEHTVLSLGGGAFIDNTIQQLLRENEIPAVFLDASADELFRRCAQPGVVRPLLADRERFDSLYEQRRPAYLKAAFCVQTAGKQIASVVDEIISRAGLDGIRSSR